MSAPDDDDGDPVVALIEECVLRMELEGSAVVDELCRAHPEHAAALRAGIGFLQQEDMVVRDDGRVPERLGDFRLLHRLGGGGMGVVYLAEQLSLHRQVAVKLVRPELLLFAGSRARFRREAEAIARLQHPGIVPVYGFGEVDGVPYFAMEHVTGASLAAVLAELAGREPDRLSAADLGEALRRSARAEPATPLPFAGAWWQVVGEIVLQLAAAVGHAHQRGVLHRDLKPSNVMMTLDGRVQLLDFGLARSEGDAALTRTGTPLGSLAYMSPEQVEGSADVGVGTDVHALGVTLYELLTLQCPFLAATGTQTRQRILDGDVVPLRRLCRQVPVDVATVCHVAMARDVGARYASAAAFAQDLANALASRPIEARPPGLVARGVRHARRHPAPTALAVALVVLVPLVSVLLGVHYANREVVARGREAARVARIDALLQHGWLLYRSEPEAAGTAFAEVLHDEPTNPLAVLGAALLVLDGPDPEGIGAFLDAHADVVQRHPTFALLRDAPWTDGTGPSPLPGFDAIPPVAVDWFVCGAIALQRVGLGDRAAQAQAIACLDQAVRLSPRTQAVFLFRLTEAASMAGDRDLLQRAAQAVLQLCPESAPALAVVGHDLAGYDTPQALRLLERAVALEPGLAMAWLYLGVARQVAHDLDRAAVAYARAAALRPEMAAAHASLANVQWRRGELDAALQSIERALALEHEDPDLHDTHGEVLAARGDTEGALAAWGQSIELAPELPWSRFHRGRHLLFIGRTADAVADLEGAAQRGPEVAIFHGTLSRALRAAGDFVAALRAADAAATLDAKDPQYAAEQAQCHQRLGDTAHAKAAFERAIGLAPGDSGLHDAFVRFLDGAGDAAASAAETARWQQRPQPLDAVQSAR